MSRYDEVREPEEPPAVWRERMMQKLAKASGMTVKELEALSPRIPIEEEGGRQ